ncbi:MAG: 16S rRNA (uracil(1498)-N(3))-methyltransferase [Clostridiales Family XIII bacterium]|jgi:16S rRNA (uracil1498-N3)-methyltransferase|nr:16S rRNA (uracil(1498)-N(3))-methyltransferase [Clostridiales Family XIII bacterium]
MAHAARRFFVRNDSFKDGLIYIEDEGDVRHIRDVLRMKIGDGLVACDGAGREYAGTIEQVGEVVTLSVSDIVHAVEPRTKIALYQCVPKHGKMEMIVQKSTELGAVRFVPVFSERSVPKPKDMERKAERWRRVAEEASKQSGRALVPVVDVPLSFAEAIETFGEFDLVVFPYEKEDRVTIKDVLLKYAERTGKDASAGGHHLAIIIGPEGGFTDAEAFALEDAGAAPCSLGGTVLRTETAGSAAIAMVRYELEL